MNKPKITFQDCTAAIREIVGHWKALGGATLVLGVVPTILAMRGGVPNSTYRTIIFSVATVAVIGTCVYTVSCLLASKRLTDEHRHDEQLALAVDRNALSKDAAYLLQEASKDNNSTIQCVHAVGAKCPQIQTNGVILNDGTSNRDYARWDKAIQTLRSIRYIEASPNNCQGYKSYTITQDGYNKIDRLNRS